MATTAKPRILIVLTCWVMLALLCACGGNGCTASVNTPTAVWAEQDIVFDKGFVLAAGTSFTARVIQVPDPEYSPLYIQNCHQPPQNAKP